MFNVQSPPSTADAYFLRNAASVRAMVATAALRDVPRSQMLDGTSLLLADLVGVDARVEPSAELLVVRNLLRRCGDLPGLGVEVGTLISFSSLGKFALALMASNTLRDAIELTISLRPLTLTFGAPLPPVEGRHRTRYILNQHDIAADVHDFIVERDLTLSARLLAVLGGDAHPLTIEAPLSGDRRAAITGAVPGARVVAGTDPAIVIPRSVLDSPLPQSDPLTLPALVAELRELATQRTAPVTTAGRVHTRLLARPEAPPTLRELAHELHLDVRSLRRRLASEATSYRRILDEVRQARAAELLSAGLPVAQVATLVGYHDAAAFSRAFRRWYGRSPGSGRRVSS